MRLVASLTLAFTLLASPALAAELRHPEPGTYVDADHQARERVAQLEDQARFDALRRHALRGQLRADGLAALGYAYALRGEAEDARAMLALAREYAGQRRDLLRHVLWSSGWAHLNLGDYDAAAEAWQASAELHGGRPFWLPYSMAVLAELRGERELAIQWYDAAARSQSAGAMPRAWPAPPTSGSARSRQRSIASSMPGRPASLCRLTGSPGKAIPEALPFGANGTHAARTTNENAPAKTGAFSFEAASG